LEIEKKIHCNYTVAKQKKFYITTAIPYVNAEPHIGFALELIQTDAVARYHRQNGNDVFFLTGTDENSLKNVQAAEKAGMETPAFVEKNTQRFIELAETLNVSNDDFIRTTSKKHFDGAQKLWSACKKEDIYKKRYSGLYCVGCEQFYTEKELVDGKCPEHYTVPETVEEENYFFRLSSYQKQLEKLITSDTLKIVPESRKNEALSFIRMGLEDFSISRSQKRARNWGVPVPNDLTGEVMYVWFDALSNYITALDYDGNGDLFGKYWPADVHVIGKGVIRFHAIYWPAMLLSAGLQLPKELFVHGYINVDGTKMSKSLGNVVNPFVTVSKYGVDVVRYYLLRYLSPYEDSSFSETHLGEVYVSDLSNGLGNVVSRVTGLIEQNQIPIKIKAVKSLPKEYRELFETFNFNDALKLVWRRITTVDELISRTKPRELAKAGKTKELGKILNEAAQTIYEVGRMLGPCMPETADRVEKIITATTIKKSEPLFPRLT